jgi:hypothetical protein
MTCRSDSGRDPARNDVSQEELTFGCQKKKIIYRLLGQAQVRILVDGDKSCKTFI